MSDDDLEDLEQGFRDRYGEDPAGAVFQEIIKLHQRLNVLESRLGQLRSIVKEVDPERMDRLEMKESLRSIESLLSETE